MSIKIPKDTECMDKWKELTVRLHLNQTIDKENQNLMDDQRKKWRAVFESVADVT